ncbi:OmpH family outer membrane protein [Fundidesulfovibrio terrae]|uniref:OmpH family outer membrane protein n=1 Tax=Fundidesulfovibrio terrae TaxID=2922866 RepID=UPI001FAE8106|nr:OmpH family outer membrane protein [Fundidesulfovibrio terrae]
MRNLLKYLVLSAVIMAMPVLAQAADKIGVVNSQDVVMNSEAGKRAMQELQNKANAKQQELTRQSDELKKMDENFRKQSVTLSAEAKAKMQSEMETKFKKMMDDQNTFNQQMGQEQTKVLEPLMKVFDQVVAEYAKKNGFSMIVERRAVLFVGSGLDVTADITKDFEAAAKRGK